MKDGIYDWKQENQSYVHKSCQNKCESLMKDGVPRVIVSNTSTTQRELNPYLDLAKIYGYTVISLIVENRHGGKNIHGVPKETLNKMQSRFNIKLI